MRMLRLTINCHDTPKNRQILRGIKDYTLNENYEKSFASIRLDAIDIISCHVSDNPSYRVLEDKEILCNDMNIISFTSLDEVKAFCMNRYKMGHVPILNVEYSCLGSSFKIIEV